MNGIDAVPFVSTIRNNFKLLFIVGLVIAISTACLLKFVVKERFESKVVVYAAQTYTESLIMPPLEFGYDRHADQFIQIMNSSDVRDAIMSKYNLLDHYDIDTTGDLRWKDELNERYLRNIWIDYTQYDAIDVNVIDSDPNVAANIANDIVRIAGDVKRNLFREKVLVSLEDRRREYNEKMVEVDSLQVLLADLGGKLDRDNRYDLVNVQFERVRKDYLAELERLNGLKGKFETIANYLNTDAPMYYIVSDAEPNYKKISPKVVVTTLVVTITFELLFLVVLAFFEKIKSLKAQA